MSNDTLKWWPTIQVIKYDPSSARAIARDLGHEPTGPELREMERLGLIVPDDIVHAEGNQLVTVGLDRIGDLIVADGSPQAFTASRGVGGVGNGTGSFSAAHTALQGASQYYKGIDGAPSSANGVITASTTFTGSDANFAWEEWCWAIATAAPVANASFATATTSGVMLNRKVQTLGTKASGATWTLQATVTLS